MARNTELASKWLREAARHERLADEIFQREGDDFDSEERLLCLENARVLRNCARELADGELEATAAAIDAIWPA